MTESRTVTEQWAAFAAGLWAQPVPPATFAAARGLFADVLGVAVGNAGGPACDAVVGAVTAMGLSGTSPVPGRHERLPPVWAALVCGTAACGRAAPVVAASLTSAELVGASTDDLLVGLICGIELSDRLERGLTEAHQRRGWDVTGTVGHVGAAAAAATLLGLPEPEWCNALAIAATQAAGHLAQAGTMALSVHSGKAASDAVEAALLAEGGFTGPRTAIDGPRGLAAILTEDADLPALVRDLGVVWATDRAPAARPDDFTRRVGPVLGDRTDALWDAATGADGSVPVGSIFALSRPNSHSTSKVR